MIDTCISLFSRVKFQLHVYVNRNQMANIVMTIQQN